MTLTAFARRHSQQLSKNRRDSGDFREERYDRDNRSQRRER